MAKKLTFFKININYLIAHSHPKILIITKKNCYESILKYEFDKTYLQVE